MIDMSGVLNGPLCQIAEAALENVCEHVPLGKVGFKCFQAVKNGVINSRKLSEEEKIRIKYKNIEAHIEGACKLLKPAMELKNILVSESKSADRAKPGVHRSASLQYYTPQKTSRECFCVEDVSLEDFPKGNQCLRQKAFASRLKKDNSKYRGSLMEENGLSTDSASDSESDLKSKNNIPWKKCDACKAVSKILIRTTCDHAICKKCVESGKDCQKCFEADKKTKNERKQQLYPQLIFDTD